MIDTRPVSESDKAFAREFKDTLTDKRMSFSWTVGEDGEPCYFYVNGTPTAWRAFLEGQAEALVKAKEVSP